MKHLLLRSRSTHPRILAAMLQTIRRLSTGRRFSADGGSQRFSNESAEQLKAATRSSQAEQLGARSQVTHRASVPADGLTALTQAGYYRNNDGSLDDSRTLAVVALQVQNSSIENFAELSAHNRVAPCVKFDSGSVMSREPMGINERGSAEKEAKPLPPPQKKRPPPMPKDAVHGRARPKPPARTAEYGWGKDRGSTEDGDELGSLEESTNGSLKEVRLKLGEMSFSLDRASSDRSDRSISLTQSVVSAAI